MRGRLCAVLAACTLSACALLHPLALRDFPADFESPHSGQANDPMPGFGGGGQGLGNTTPVIFIHGNTESAHFWLPARNYFLGQAWDRDALWAFSYGRNDVRHFDSNDAAAASIGRMVDAVTRYVSQRSGHEVRQVDIVAHSLGVTAVRQWMKQANAWHRVRSFVAIAGANHGTWVARADARGRNRASAFELAPDSPWLQQLNRGGETPGATRYLALYDGTGRSDALFPAPLQHSPRLEAATNLAFNLERNRHLNHRELAQSPQALAAAVQFLRDAPQALDQVPPTLAREGDQLRAEPASARLACAVDGAYPNRSSALQHSVQLAPGVVTTCFALDARSGLSSPMRHFLAASAPHRDAEINLEASAPAGRYEWPLELTLKVSEPGAALVYTTNGMEPDAGSPLYQGPIAIASTLTLRALAISADGRRSPGFQARYEIDTSLIDDRRSLQRQLEGPASGAFE